MHKLGPLMFSKTRCVLRNKTQNQIEVNVLLVHNSDFEQIIRLNE